MPGLQSWWKSVIINCQLKLLFFLFRFFDSDQNFLLKTVHLLPQRSIECSALLLDSGLAACHEKRGPHEAPGKSVKTSANKMCPYSHPSSQNTNGSSAGNSLSTSADLCKTTSKHYKTMCRRPTPPGNTASYVQTAGESRIQFYIWQSTLSVLSVQMGCESVHTGPLSNPSDRLL